jgi:cytoskeletal protein RodZ
MRMESDEFDYLAPAYVRSFLKTYARFLGLDPGPLVAEFDRRYGAAKFETAQIAALERRAKQAPRQRRLNSWATAAVVASVVLVGLAAIGLATGKKDKPGADVAQIEESQTPAQEASAEAEPTPTPSSDEKFVALSDGIELEVVASQADCWLEVYADGASRPLYYATLATGDSEVFRATDKMFVRLGYPAGVELIVNGKNIGSPGGQDPIRILLPDDVESYF